MKRCDIFCRVIDNYGDIGVCWRLAVQLAHEYGLSVRLWVDDWAAAKRLIGSLDPNRLKQTVSGVELCRWGESFDDTEVTDMVIEAFACELPASYLAAMVKKQPAWLNLEYLSAEPWIAESHLLASPHPTLPLTKHFFFPGFDPKTGGLIRERSLIEKRDHFLQSPQAQTAFWKKLGLPNIPSLKISLFCYPHAPLQALLDAVAGSAHPATLFVPESSAMDAIGDQLDMGRLRVGDTISKGNLTLHVLPFLTQEDYDQLLWACDINFVRGEDSWVRGLWAAKPMVWQPYLQQEDAHLIKLQAFLNFYTAGLSEDGAQVVQQLHMEWCSGGFTKAMWELLLLHLEKLRSHAAKQSAALVAQPDLAAKLVIFGGNFSK